MITQVWHHCPGCLDVCLSFPLRVEDTPVEDTPIRKWSVSHSELWKLQVVRTQFSKGLQGLKLFVELMFGLSSRAESESIDNRFTGPEKVKRQTEDSGRAFGWWSNRGEQSFSLQIPPNTVMVPLLPFPAWSVVLFPEATV